MVEFDEDIIVEEVKLKVKDEVDSEKVGEDWFIFNNVKVEFNVFDFNFLEEILISNINIKGNYFIIRLKEYVEYLEDKIEDFFEIKQVDICGVQDKEVEVVVDVYKMMVVKVSFDDVINVI